MPYAYDRHGLSSPASKMTAGTALIPTLAAVQRMIQAPLTTLAFFGSAILCSGPAAVRNVSLSSIPNRAGPSASACSRSPRQSRLNRWETIDLDQRRWTVLGTALACLHR